MWRRIGIVARREFLFTVKRKEFLLITFGLPLLYVLLIAMVGAATASAVKTSRQGKPEPKVVGFIDQTGKLNRAALEQTQGDIAGRVYDSVETGQKAVVDKDIRALVVVGKDFDKSDGQGGGKVTIYAPEKSDSIFGDSKRSAALPFATTLRRAALAGKVNEETIDRATRLIGSTTLNYDAKTGKFGEPNVFGEIGKFAVPYAFSLLLMGSVVFSASYLLHGIVEEKENRVIEVLLSAATHEELLAGKIVGLGGAGLLQLGIWVSGALITVTVIALSNPQFAVLSASPMVVATALTMFVLGFCLYASVMAGVGSLGTSWRESQQMSGAVVMPLVMPLMLMPVILEQPNGPVARILSLFPLTAPIGMMLRIAAGGGSALEVVLAAILLAATVYFVIRLAARLFRLSLLMYGQRPDAKLVMRHLFTKA